MTWIQRLSALTVLVMIVATVAVSSPAASETPAADAGQLSTSMVEMLAGQNVSGVVELEALRAVTLQGFVGSDGSGVDVAVIDTGVAPVPGLDGADKVLHGPDLSFESASSEAAYLDTFGHGTHMAGIIAGERNGARGIAPGARIVSVKVAGHDGLTTVPQVIAAIDWVVDHRNTDGLNIRVLNLSLGQDGVTTHVGDLLSAAVERAWQSGIFVVVAAGNDGTTQPHLDSPAIDPYVVAVGAADSLSAEAPKHFRVPAWSATGDGVRNPSLVAAGRSIASYRVPGSTIDAVAPSARFGDDFFRGSGTSQAAAAISGVAAVAFSEHPYLSADDLKLTMIEGRINLSRVSELVAGKGLVNGKKAASKPRDAEAQSHPTAAGAGTGILAPTGATWSGGTWSSATWSGATWSGATWSGGTWSGATWSGATWSGATWSGATWSGGTWSGATWSGATWSGVTWSGGTWSGNGWGDDASPSLGSLDLSEPTSLTGPTSLDGATTLTGPTSFTAVAPVDAVS